VSAVQPGVRLHLSGDGVTLGDPVVIWSEAPGSGCYWAQYPNDRRAFRVRVTHLKIAPHPMVVITEEQP
jgi:hypothetical protein